MRDTFRHPLVLALFLCAILVAPSRAQGLVQITLAGEIVEPGGARAEIDIGFVVPQTGLPARMTLAGLFGQSTSAADLSNLVTARLQDYGVRAISLGSHAPLKGPVNLYVDGVTSVGLRLGHGLSAQLTLCEDRPGSVKLTPGAESRLGAEIDVVALTVQDQTRTNGRLTIHVKLDDDPEITDVGMRLVHAAIQQGWPAELKGHDTWCPAASTETERVTSCSFALRSTADWRLDVALAPRQVAR